MQPKKWIKLLTATLITGSFLLTTSAGLAQDPQDDAAFNCSSAINVMDCIKQTGVGTVKPADVTAIPINSQALGFSGPISAGLRYDNYLAWILDVGYAQEFYNAAAAFKLSAGLNERRANVTLGYAITPKQQIKLTYEYLSQNLPFDYASGKVNEWVNQNAFGAAYRYMLDYGMLRALEVYGTYTKANSKALSEVEMYTDNLLTQINYRRIAGGTEKVAGATFTLTPFKGTIVKVGGGYSTLSFDTKWENSEDTAALVYNAEIAHLLTPTTLISTSIGNTASGRTHTAKVSQILPWSLEASLIGQYTATTNDIPGSTSVTAALSYPAPKTYTNMFAAGIGKLKDWVEKPVLYHTRVLAKAEERIVQVQIVTAAIPPVFIPVGATLNPPIQTKDYFVFNTEVLDKINYQIISITNQSDHKPATTNLNLQIVPVDSYNATLVSQAPVTIDMMANSTTPGQYQLTLEAQGYRKGQIVSKVDNPVNISVGANNQLIAPSWNTKATLPHADSNTNSYAADLNPLITNNNPGVNDHYVFSLAQSSPWFQVADDQHTLVSKATLPTDPTIPVVLQAVSQASGKSAQPATQQFVIDINGEVVGPQWLSNANLPAAVVGTDYSTHAITLNPYTSPAGATPYLSGTKKSGIDISDTVSFDIDTAQNTCGWIQLADTSLGSFTGTPPTNASASCILALKVFSQALDNQAYTITKSINVNMLTPPDWKNGVNTLPGGVDQSPYPISAALNPYSYTPVDSDYLWPTRNGNTTVDDRYTFKFDPASHADACGAWLTIDPNSGVLKQDPAQSVPNYGSAKTCYAYIQIQSDKLGLISLVKKPISLASAGYTLPDWISSLSLPSATVNEDYDVKNVILNPYETSSPYVSKTQYGSGEYPTNDLNFRIEAGSCSWLQFKDGNTRTATLSGKVSGASCNAVISVYSQTAGGSYQLLASGAKPIAVGANTPQWENTNVTIPYPQTSPFQIVLKNFIVPPVPNDIKFINLNLTTPPSHNLPSGSISSGISGTAPNSYVEVTPPTTADIDNNKIDMGSFTVSATLSETPGVISTGTINVKVTATLQNPTTTGAPLPAAVVGQSNTYNIDPYRNGNNTTYVTKTKVTNVTPNEELPNDQLTFTQTATTCTWANIAANGIVTVAPPAQGNLPSPECRIDFSIKSSKNDQLATATHIMAPLKGIAPSYPNPITSPIRFDDTTNGILLNNLVPPDAQITGLYFTFSNGDMAVDPSTNWTIANITEENGTINYYLRRRLNNDGKYYADKVGTNESVEVRASNLFGSTAAGTASTLSVPITADNQTIVQLNPTFAQQTLQTTIGTAYSLLMMTSDPDNSLLQTVTQDGTLIAGDAITNSGAALTNPNNANAVIATYGTNNMITIPSTLNNQKDGGAYHNGSLSGIITRAKGVAATVALPEYTFTIHTYLNWNTNTLAPILFDQTTPGAPAPSLNNLVDSPSTVPNLEFKLERNSAAANFDAANQTGQWYLVRITRNEGSIVYLDATDIGTPPAITINACSNPNSISGSCFDAAGSRIIQKNFNVTVNADTSTNVQVYWNGGNFNVPYKDNKTKQCYYDAYNGGNFEYAHLITVAKGIRVKDVLTMNCAHNGSNSNADLNYYKTGSRIGYLGSNSSNNCNSVYLVSQPNVAKTDLTYGSYLIIIRNLSSKAAGTRNLNDYSGAGGAGYTLRNQSSYFVYYVPGADPVPPEHCD